MTAKADGQDSAIHKHVAVSALVVATLAAAIGVTLGYYVEFIIMLLTILVALGVARAYPHRQVVVFCGVGATGALVILVVNRMITHEIRVVNESGATIEYLSINVDVSPGESSQYVLRNLGAGQRWCWTFRSFFSDGRVQVDGKILGGNAILGGSWNAEGGLYKGRNCILIEEGGHVRVLRK